MLRWILALLIIALIAGGFGFSNLAGTFANIARVLFFIFVVLLVVAAMIRVVRGNQPD